MLTEADDLLLAELAFGLLDGEEVATAHVRVVLDPSMRARLADWRLVALALVARPSACAATQVAGYSTLASRSGMRAPDGSEGAE